MFIFQVIQIISVSNLILCAPWTLNKPIDKNLEKKIVNDDNVEYYDKNYESDLQREDEYHTYMEKKVAKIIYNGGNYLEGLKRALQNYGERIDNCTNNYRNLNTNLTDPTQQIDYNRCQKEVMESEKVRRVAQLAIVTTREIQDRKTNQHYEDELENKSLLLRLAWLLDRLAQMTGFEPKPEDYLTAEPTVPTTTRNPMLILQLLRAPMNVSADRKMAMINCLDRSNNSTEPAYRRCPQEAPMIVPLRNMYNRSGLLTPSASLAAANAQTSSTETIVTTEATTNKMADERSNFTINPQNVTSGSRKRRDIFHYNKHKKPISRIPEDPYQDVSAYVKSKPGTNITLNPQDGVLVRLDLERAFQTPNIEIARRYGANYNPANPNVLLSGIARSLLDI